MVSRVRKAIAVVVALVVTVLTLGRIHVNWTGGPAAADAARDPNQAAVTRSCETGGAAPDDLKSVAP
jgi:hypothetical protein